MIPCAAKVTYGSREEAEHGLTATRASVQNRGAIKRAFFALTTTKAARSAYKCQHCQRWHLTSQAFNDDMAAHDAGYTAFNAAIVRAVADRQKKNEANRARLDRFTNPPRLATR